MICWGCELLRFSLCCTSFWWTWQPLHLGWLLRVATFCFSPEGGNETSSWNKGAKIKQNSQQSYPVVPCNFWPTVHLYPPIHPASSDVAEEPQYGQCTVRASSEVSDNGSGFHSQRCHEATIFGSRIVGIPSHFCRKSLGMVFTDGFTIRSIPIDFFQSKWSKCTRSNIFFPVGDSQNHLKLSI